VQLGFGRGEAVAANSGEECGGELGVTRRKKRKSSRRKAVRVGFYRGAQPCKREGEREAVTGRLRTAGGAGVPLGAWQLLGSGGPTWLHGDRPAGATRAVGEVVGRSVGEGRAVQVCRSSGIGR
jgi:hypothetical protein